MFWLVPPDAVSSVSSSFDDGDVMAAICAGEFAGAFVTISADEAMRASGPILPEAQLVAAGESAQTMPMANIDISSFLLLTISYRPFNTLP